MAPRKIIIDTDPGVDDVLAMLLALAATPEELEVPLISVTYGNIDVANCLRNVVSLFHHVEKEIAWRESRGVTSGFETLKKTRPIVAVGPSSPLADQQLMADFFHGTDGLGGIHSSHPHLTPDQTWDQLSAQAGSSSDLRPSEINGELAKKDKLFIPTTIPGHQEILRVLRENEPDTITIVALGPLTNLALAAAEDPETFLRTKEVVVMGGNIDHAGNMTPVAEFNTFADAVAAARLYALTSPNPHTTMPPTPPAPPGQDTTTPPPPHLSPYPPNLSRQLKVTLVPLDITEKHLLLRGEYNTLITPLLTSGSPLAEWLSAFLTSTFTKIESLNRDISGDNVGLQLHDPLCIWYCMTSPLPSTWSVTKDEDIRVETTGHWTRGMCVIDRRTRRMRDDRELQEIPGDDGNWLSRYSGNRMGRVVGTPGESVFGGYLLKRVLGL